MVNNNTTTSASKDSNDDEYFIAEICVSIDDLCRQNKTLEDNVHHIQQCQQGTNMVEELEVLDPQPLSDKIWEASVLEKINFPSLAKFDRCIIPYEHVASFNV